jgi:hypothetical protein
LSTIDIGDASRALSPKAFIFVTGIRQEAQVTESTSDAEGELAALFRLQMVEGWSELAD